jgi:hypothetical protein
MTAETTYKRLETEIQQQTRARMTCVSEDLRPLELMRSAPVSVGNDTNKQWKLWYGTTCNVIVKMTTTLLKHTAVFLEDARRTHTCRLYSIQKRTRERG